MEPKDKVEQKKANPSSPSLDKKNVVSTYSSTEPTIVKVDTAQSDEEDALPKIRIRAEEKGEKVKKFASAQGASMHMKAAKVKKAGLSALHKAATWISKATQK